MKDIFKYIVIALGSLTAIATLFIGTWIAVNAWPREMEPTLWTEAELDISVDPEKNGWNALPKRGEPEPFKYTNDLIPDEWFELTEIYREEEPQDAALFFAARAPKAFEKLADHYEERSAGLKFYNKILNHSQFVDTDPASLDKKSPDRIYLGDLHRIGLIHVFETFMKQDREAAYAFWLKMFKLDKAWLFSARTVTSNAVAIDCLKEDLVFLYVMYSMFPPNNREPVGKALSELDTAKISFKRALIYEYNWSLNVIKPLKPEEIIDPPEISKKPPQRSAVEKWFAGILFNRAPIRKGFNQYFGQYAYLLENPDRITAESEQEMDAKIESLTKGPFWWFYNPIGKTLQSLVSINLVGPMIEYYYDKQLIEKYIAGIQALRK